jgi:hypothetical protein
LEGSTSEADIGNYIEPGLPNIRGQAGIGDNAVPGNPSKLLAMNTCSGALIPSLSGIQVSYSDTYLDYDEKNPHCGGLAFNASICNTIYKDNFNTVQPPAGVVIYLIRY